MKSEDLHHLISGFNEDELKQIGTFGIYQYDEDSNLYFIQANKEGLQLFAIQLLKASHELDETSEELINFDCSENWMTYNGDVFINSIIPTSKIENEKIIEDDSIGLKMRLLTIGYTIIMSLFILFALIGLGVIIKLFID